MERLWALGFAQFWCQLRFPKPGSRFPKPEAPSPKPYPFGSNFNDTELMQKRTPLGGGPSGKTWPKCDPQREHVTSTRRIPKLVSSWASKTSSDSGCENAGQPQPE